MQEFDNKKSLDIAQFSRDQQNKSVEEYQLTMIGILNTLSSKDKQDLMISLLGLLAKESKQLPNNHQVTVSNPTDVSALATEETLQKLVGFEIPPYDDIVLSYTDGDLTKVEYKKDTVLVYTLNLSYTDGNLTRVWQV